MYAVRARRVAPGTDDKLLTDWTALAISAFALAARVYEEPRYERAARGAADRILSKCVRGGELLHRERAGRAGIPGFASDYAYLVEALLDLYEATFETRYFSEAVRLQDAFEERFAEPGGGYFLAAADHDGLILRPRESWDGATPSSNSVAAMNLLRLSVFTGEERVPEARRGSLRQRGNDPRAVSHRAPAPALRVDFGTAAPREVVLAGTPGRDDFEALRRAVFASPRLNRVVAHADTRGGRARPRGPRKRPGSRENGAAAAYVCSGFACRAPVSAPDALAASLAAP